MLILYILGTMEDYNQIVNDWYIKLRNYFINTVHNKLPVLRIEDIEDVYSEAFIAVRQNLLGGKVEQGTNWKAYIFRIGLNMAINKAKIAGRIELADTRSDDDDIEADEKFQTKLSLLDVAQDDADQAQLQEERMAVLKRELSYLPEPCETILKSYYYGEMTMAEIMQEVGFKTTDSVKAKKYWCLNRLKTRVMATFKMLNLID